MSDNISGTIIIKCRLNTIIRDNKKIMVKKKLEDVISRVNKLTKYVYQFLRLWTLNLYHINQVIRPITHDLVMCVFALFTKQNKKSQGRERTGTNLDIYNKLKIFFNEHFSDLIEEKYISGLHLTQILSYQSTQIITNIYNNIQMHFFDYVRRFVNNSFKNKRQELLKNMKGINKKNIDIQFKKDLNILKSDLLNNNAKILSTGEYLKWYNDNHNWMFPKIDAKTVYYDDIKINPINYMSHMISMNIKLEQLKLKQFQFFPLSTSYVYNYVPFDTKTLVEMFMDGNKIDLLKNLSKSKKSVWSSIFNTDLALFNSNKHNFDYRILTDGFAVSIQFMETSKQIKKEINKAKKIKASIKIRKEQINMSKEEIAIAKKEKIITAKNIRKKFLSRIRQVKIDAKNKLAGELREIKKLSVDKREAKLKEYNDKISTKKEDLRREKIESAEFPYISDLLPSQLKELQSKHRIYIDPGKRDIFKMIGDNGKYFTYSNRERLKETKRLEYSGRILTFKKKTGIILLETSLAEYNSKSCTIKGFKDYVKNYNKISKLIQPKYTKNILEKYKWFFYINKQRSEDKLLNKMTHIYPKDSTIVIGDWSIGKQLSNFISTPMISIKRKLKQKFKVYNLDEFRTSALHHLTENRCENLYLPDKKQTLRKMHSILTFKMKNKEIGCINRDKNAVNNMKKIATSIINGHGRPLKYRRDYKFENIQIPLKVKVTNHCYWSNSNRATCEPILPA